MHSISVVVAVTLGNESQKESGAALDDHGSAPIRRIRGTKLWTSLSGPGACHEADTREGLTQDLRSDPVTLHATSDNAWHHLFLRRCRTCRRSSQ